MSGAVMEEEVRPTVGGKGAAAGPVIELVDEQPKTDGPTPEEALAASRKAISDAENATRAARQEAQQANAEVQRVRASQQQDQQAVLASAVEASTAERDRHAHAWQAAMQAGDFEAAAKHQSDQMMATAKLDRASSDLAMVKAGVQQRQQGGQQQQQPAVSNASQNWINEHKEFQRHRAPLILKHQELLNDGVQPDSPRYFRELDAEYDRLTGASGSEGGGQQQMGDKQSRQQFDGATPGRGGGGSGGGQAGTVQTLLGPVHTRQVNGQVFITIPDHLKADFAEGAKVVGMSMADYAYDQVKIAQERTGGGTGGLITSEGRKYK